jgi:hypothetical protein
VSRKKSGNEYEVGFGKPPKNTQFQKGVSGNPSGRPKKPADFDDQLLREGRLKVSIVENGQRVRTTKHDLVWKQLLHQALKGDHRAMRLYFSYHQQAAGRAAEKAKVVEDLTTKEMTKLTDEQIQWMLNESQTKEKRNRMNEDIQAAESKKKRSKAGGR